MNNRIVLFILAFVAVTLFGTEKLFAQFPQGEFSTSADRIDFNIDANQSSEVRKTFAYTVTFSNDAVHYYNDMNLSVRLNEDIANRDGGIINPSKIKIELKQIIGGPKKNQINPTRISLSKQDQNVIKVDGNWGGLFTNIIIRPGGDTWTFLFDLIINKEDLSGLENGLYPLNMDFNLSLELYFFGARNRWYSSYATSVGQINVVNYAPSFGFEVNANASLNFTTPEDYTKQVESSENSWLKVISKNTDYIVQVKTNDADFVGDKGTVPVNAVSMKVEGPPNSFKGSAIKPISLSTSEQVVFRGKATKATPQMLDVRYFITKGEAEKLAVKPPGQYTTTLTYTLTPP